MLGRVKDISVQAEDNLILGREPGRKILERVSSALREVPNFTVVPVDLSSIRFMDFSASDEFVVKLVKRIRAEEFSSRFIVLKGMNEMVQENVEAALKLSDEVCVYYSPLSNEEPLIAGTMPSTLESTYQLALKLNVITARELIEEVEQYQMRAQNKEHKTGQHEKLNIGASSNRLTRLKEMGLLVPIRVDSLAVGGRQNVYEPVR